MQNTTMPPPPPSRKPALLPHPPENPPNETKSPGLQEPDDTAARSDHTVEATEEKECATAATKCDGKEPDDTAGRSDTVEVKEEGATAATKSNGTVEDNSSSGPRERLKRHRKEVAGRVWIPDMWGQEDFLKDWIDCAAFDASLVNSSIVLARDSLMGERRRSNSTTLRIQNGC